MIKKIALGSVLSLALFTAGCAAGPSPVGIGLITDVKGPILATAATGSKTGTACANTIIGLINKGDASIAAAKADGGITVVASADYHTKGFYPFIGETCVTVTGN
ncbi:MAG: TRL-like family protein [Myxococcota bacterium]